MNHQFRMPMYLSHAEIVQRQNIRSMAWDMYYSGIMSMSLHPGTTRDRPTHRTPEEAAEIADAMIRERDKRFPMQ
jgi:kynurenine formamidase